MVVVKVCEGVLGLSRWRFRGRYTGHAGRKVEGFVYTRRHGWPSEAGAVLCLLFSCTGVGFWPQ